MLLRVLPEPRVSGCVSGVPVFSLRRVIAIARPMLFGVGLELELEGETLVVLEMKVDGDAELEFG